MDRRRFQQIPRQVDPAIVHLIEPPAPDLRRLFFNAFEHFLVHEEYLLSVEVSERTICARLGLILENKAHELGLTDYRADVEYNRMQGGTPKLIKTAVNGPYIPVTCDLVLHGRGVEQRHENLIAIEIKKWDDDPDLCDADRDRLHALTGPWLVEDWPEFVTGYRYGSFIVLRARRCANPALRWWRRAQKHEDSAMHPDYDEHGYIETFYDGNRVANPYWFRTTLPTHKIR